ncbi:DUF805 domain-containing protein [Salmonella enterica]|nr:DUF805 domain-containing protein [Salmonella enterica]
MQWYLQVLKSYAVFSGRARRKEYWMFTLINIIVSVILSIIQSALGMEEHQVIILIYSLILLLPSIGVSVRRLHDTERSGYWILIGLIPLIGSIVLLVFMCQNGTTGRNKYGADPKRGEII